VDEKFSTLGQVVYEAVDRMRDSAEQAREAARQAGLRLIDQDAENQRQIAAALKAPSGQTPGLSESGLMSTSGTDTSQPHLTNQPTTPVRPEGDPAAGTFPLGVPPEALGNFTIDAASLALDPALPDTLHTLAQQWLQLANSLNAALFTFDNQYSSVLGSKQFSGYAANQMKSALSAFSASGKRVAFEAQVNAAAVAAWAGAVGQSKSQIESLKSSRDRTLATTPDEDKLTYSRLMDGFAQMQLDATWNQPLAALNTSLANISDPSSPVAGTALVLGAPRGGVTSDGPGSLGSTSSSVGPGGTGPSGGSKAASTAANAAKAGAGDPAGTLKRAGTGDPVAAAKDGSQSGSQNPASAAQSALSKAGDAAKGPGGAPTRTSGLSNLSRPGAAELGKAAGAGAGAGGGGAKGGGGAGGLGGGIGRGGAGAEAPLSSRSGAGLSAAERAMASEQAATRATPATGTTGAPMGARGAPGGQKAEEGKHTSARYLQSTENGEEIVGELDDVAPMVIGGLNLDTTDDTDTTTKAPQSE
jgi:hypothetical protein